jgi:hypothetical protein
LISKGQRVLYRGHENPFKSSTILLAALRRGGLRLLSRD